MQTILIMLLLLTVAGVLWACQTPRNDKPGTAASPVTVIKIKALSQSQIKERLSQLQTRSEPLPKMGAMCYKMAASPDRAEYLCPTCGEKTLYRSDMAHFIEQSLGKCRRKFEHLKEIDGTAFSLDESRLCHKCQPKADNRLLALTVRYQDGKTHTTLSVNELDLQLLCDFVDGKESYSTSNDGEYPLKRELPRLRELLGMKDE